MLINTLDYLLEKAVYIKHVDIRVLALTAGKQTREKPCQSGEGMSGNRLRTSEGNGEQVSMSAQKVRKRRGGG